MAASQYSYRSPDSCYPASCGDSVGEPYVIVGNAVAATTPITIIGFANHSMTPIGFRLSGGKTIISCVTSGLTRRPSVSANGGGRKRVPAPASVLLNPRFLYPPRSRRTVALQKATQSATIVTNNDASSNVALVGAWSSIGASTPVSGIVDVTFQP